MLVDLAITAGVVFALNLLPAFGPPTWIALAFLRINLDVAAVPLVIVGAMASASGRYTLARGARRIRTRLPAERRESLEALRDHLESRPSTTTALLATFLVSPLPSAQLFIAAGLSDIRLWRLTAVFFAGRLVTYSIYVAGTVVAVDKFGDVLTHGIYSPLGVALQLLMIAGLVALVRIDWAARLTPRAARKPDAEPPAADRR